MAFRGGALVVVVGLCLLYLNGCVGEGGDGESSRDLEHTSRVRLMDQLLSTPHMLVIPRTPVNVDYGIELISIDGVDEKENILRLSAWAKVQWSDHRFQWDPAQFDGVSIVRLSPKLLWYPDLKLYAQVLELEDVNLLTYADGTIYHVVPMRLALPCHMQFANYPFDVQTCDLKLGSWTYDASMVNLTVHPAATGVGLESYRLNSQWELQYFTVHRNVTEYLCCVEKYIDLTFRIQVKRTVGEYTVRVLAPSVVTSLMILLCFLLPPQCGVGRIVLCSVLLLGVLLQLFHLNLTVPLSGPDAPFLADFLCFSVFLAFFAAVESVVTMNIASCGRGSGNDRPTDGDDFGLPAKPNTGLMRVARLIDVGCFIVFTFVFAIAGGVTLNPKTE